MTQTTKATFFDKDALLNMNHPCHLSEGLGEWLPDTIEGLRLLYLAGYALIVVTQDDEAAPGRFTRDTIFDEEFTFRINLATLGIPLINFYHCPLHPPGRIAAFAHACRCHKPKPGLLIQAAIDFNVDLRRSWMIGDVLDAVEAGQMAGCRTIMLTNGQETNWNMTERRWPDFLAANMLEAGSSILLTDMDRGFDGSLGALGTEDEEANL